MIKQFITFIAILNIGFSGIFGATSAYKLGDLGEPRSSYMLGSAPEAKGRNVIVSLFVDTPLNTWTDKEMEDTLIPLKKACDYIEKSAERYDTDTEFIYDFKDEKDLKLRTRIYKKVSEDDAFTDFLDKRTAIWIKYHTDYDKLLKEYDADGVFMIIHFKEEGRSYAVCYDGEDNEDESLIVYADASPAEYAHEILHLYGAHDFYKDAEYTDDVVKYIEKNYPKDIMLSLGSEGRINRDIGPITAYHLGWIEEPKEVGLFEQLRR